MSDVKSCLLVGVGGQGAILISKIMSNGFMKAGYDVKQSEVHGMAQRGGSVSTQVRWAARSTAPCLAAARPTSWWPWRRWKPSDTRSS